MGLIANIINEKEQEIIKERLKLICRAMITDSHYDQLDDYEFEN
jgi:hypothetical protein